MVTWLSIAFGCTVQPGSLRWGIICDLFSNCIRVFNLCLFLSTISVLQPPEPILGHSNWIAHHLLTASKHGSFCREEKQLLYKTIRAQNFLTQESDRPKRVSKIRYDWQQITWLLTVSLQDKVWGTVSSNIALTTCFWFKSTSRLQQGGLMNLSAECFILEGWHQFIHHRNTPTIFLTYSFSWPDCHSHRSWVTEMTVEGVQDAVFSVEPVKSGENTERCSWCDLTFIWIITCKHLIRSGCVSVINTQFMCVFKYS